jgi:hypothetical protein
MENGGAMPSRWSVARESDPKLNIIAKPPSGDVSYHQLGSIEGAGSRLHCKRNSPRPQYNKMAEHRLHFAVQGYGSSIRCRKSMLPMP